MASKNIKIIEEEENITEEKNNLNVNFEEKNDCINNNKLDNIYNVPENETNYSNSIIKTNNFIKELLNKQLQNINPSKKLNYNDLKRISKFLTSSIFDEKKCSIWNGYITNEKNHTKGIYINFYFNQKKIALHRLLYLNYIGDILNTEYIKFSCVNKGKCCNIHHMKKYSYNTNATINNDLEDNTINSVHIIQNKKNLVVEL